MTDETSDRDAIHVLMARYNIEGDRGNVAGLAATFAEDGVIAFNGVTTTGRAGIEERLSTGTAARNKALTVVRHHLTTSLIEVDGDSAQGRTYFHVLTDIGSDHHGVYVDRFARIDGAWAIVHRQVRIDWQAPNSLFGPQHVRGKAPGAAA